MKRLLIIFMLLLPAVTHAQKDRTISDLLYFPFSCISDPMTTKDQAWQAVIDTFGYCESVNLCPGIHAGSNFDFTYRGIPIAICYYDWYDRRTWYDFFFETKSEADQFYGDLVNDIRGAGIPLTKDNIYGGMSNRRKPTSNFKWVSVETPVKVKEASPSNIELADHVGKYKVELGVMKTKK